MIYGSVRFGSVRFFNYSFDSSEVFGHTVRNDNMLSAHYFECYWEVRKDFSGFNRIFLPEVTTFSYLRSADG
jgi:hypothetical protein